jgi:hypothetical protein
VKRDISAVNSKNNYPDYEMNMRKTVLMFLLWVLLSPCPVPAQEIYFDNGIARQTRSNTTGYAGGLTYLEGLGERAAWSLTYLNEGHVTEHKRDGFTPQFWGRLNVFDRRVSLAAGAGPYFYYDTVSLETKPDASNEHGMGAMVSLAATLYTESRFLVQARANWIWTHQNANAYVATLGVGYQFEKPPSVGPLTGASRQSDQEPQTAKNEIALLAGGSVPNSEGRDALAVSLEYRRSLTRYFDWSIGWLDEGSPVSRSGPITQIWAGRSFFDDQLRLVFGAGPYLAYDTHGDRDITKVNWLIGATVSYQFVPQWAIRFTYNRVTTGNNRDADVMMAGIGYRF